MHSSRKLLTKSLTVFALVMTLWLAGARIAQAQPEFGLNFAASIGLGDQDPRMTAAKIIRFALGFLGIVAVGLVLYAGWLWMTAAGNEEKIDKAKKILKGGIIGLIIILASFGIVSFIISRLFQATGGGGSGGGVCTPSCIGTQNPYCCNGACQATPCNNLGGGNSFLVSGIVPRTGSLNLPRNTVVRYKFNENVKAATVDDTTFIVEDSAHTPIAGTRVVNGKLIEFTPNTLCPPPNDTLHCFASNSRISVTAKQGQIKSASDRTLDCPSGSPCTTDFETGNYVDTQSPRINITTRQVCALMNTPLDASATDDNAVSYVDFFVAGNFVDSAINTGPPTPFNASILWDASGFTVGQNVLLKATAYDIDSNNTSAQKTVRLSPGHCCNGIQDIDPDPNINETGIDCGGSCLACDGNACAIDQQQPTQCSDSLCQSDYCTTTGSDAAACSAGGYGSGVTSCCLCQSKPQIDDISPVGGFCSNAPNTSCTVNTELVDCGAVNSCDLATPNGNSGNFLTIQGRGFGTSRGKVFFTGAGGAVQAVLANDPILGNALCNNNVWTNNQIIVVVPATAINGPITVETSTTASDTTADANGPLINDFKKNTIDRPGICTIAPTSGQNNTPIVYNGIKLTGADAYFGSLLHNIKSSSPSFTNPKTGTAIVPNLATGQTTTYVLKANVYSNFLAFTKDPEPYNGPIISSINPISGPVGQYVTIRGSGFGNTRGTSRLFFGDLSGTEADYKFPDVCAQSIWTDNQIIIKVPAGISLGQYKLTLKRDSFSAVDSSPEQFEVITGTPNPGFCRIEPALGQPNGAVILWGEYFKNFNSTNSIVRFYNNKEQLGTAITFWDIDQSARGIKPWKVVTTVHTNAISGPVQVEASGQSSNSLNFAVGVCSSDQDCGGFEVCCAAGLPEAGRCKANASQCYGNVATSVYEWQFSTGYQSSSCLPGEDQCGTKCCPSGECEDPIHSKCNRCTGGLNQCTDGSCCINPCVSNGQGGTTCVASCAGYNMNQCIDGYFCPNSPGQCSPSAGTGNPVVTGQCGTNFCNSQPGCQNNSCDYNLILNRCIKTATVNEGCSAADLKDDNGNPIVISGGGGAVQGDCTIFNGNPRWKISWRTSCPSGWVRGVGNTCVDSNKINGVCSICGNGESCVANGDRGVCAVGSPICTNGATCDLATNECKKVDQGTCDCCCRKDHVQQDCCQNDPNHQLTCGDSCGAGDPNLGLCSGCVVNGNPDDSLCNCTGTTGKFCDATTNPRGVCKDCASITDPNLCSSHSECCLDAKNGNKCTSVQVGQVRVPEIVGNNTLQYCGYFNCTNLSPNSCNLAPVKNGVYNTLTSCQQSCVSAAIPCSTSNSCANPSCPSGFTCEMGTCTCKKIVTPPDNPCRDPNNQMACLLTGCAAGYNCIDRPGVDTCRCCCKPPVNPGDPDSCKVINPILSCLPNQGNCSGPDRGACCGCSKDSDCGDTATTGCGTTGSRCCSSRPAVIQNTPLPDSTNVCRNTAIEALFDHRMDIASFSEAKNVEIIGDFGTGSCPGGYGPVLAGAPVNRLAKWLTPLRKVAVKIAPFLLTKPAFADMSAFCPLIGSPVGSDISDTSTKLSYRLLKPLEPNRKYYVVLKGDPDLPDFVNNHKDYYNDFITSLTNIGMIGVVKGPNIPALFNTTEFKNAEIWVFTTGNEICALNSVTTSPSFHLFQTTGEKKILTADAHSRNGQTLQSIPTIYDWSWSWSSDNDDIATVTQQPQPNISEVTAGNKKDAETLGKATATITADTLNQVSTQGRKVQGSSRLRLFLCENPWPIYLTIPGYVWPWKDNATGIEFYYCRDKNGVGTSDDLPALKEDPLVKSAGRRICMTGSKVGQTCTSDANCGGITSSCWPEVLKEFFFFREAVPQAPVISGVVEAVGGKITLTWPPVLSALKYKIYYGLHSGQYNFNTEITTRGTPVQKTIDGLANGLKYYFAVTSLSDKNQESRFSNELMLKPADTTPPAKPNVLGSGGDTKINLFWDPVPEATSYIAYMGAEPRPNDAHIYPNSKTVRSTPGPHQPNVTFNGLNNNGTYYLAVKSVDQYGNLSSYSDEIIVKPNTPYLMSALNSRVGSVTLEWLPFTGAQGYTITYWSGGILNRPTIDVSGSTFSHTFSNLTIGDLYSFKIVAKKTNGRISNDSNQLDVRVH